jgi:hypothetical protein
MIIKELWDSGDNLFKLRLIIASPLLLGLLIYCYFKPYIKEVKPPDAS